MAPSVRRRRRQRLSICRRRHSYDYCQRTWSAGRQQYLSALRVDNERRRSKRRRHQSDRWRKWDTHRLPKPFDRQLTRSAGINHSSQWRPLPSECDSEPNCWCANWFIPRLWSARKTIRNPATVSVAGAVRAGQASATCKLLLQHRYQLKI